MAASLWLVRIAKQFWHPENPATFRLRAWGASGAMYHVSVGQRHRIARAVVRDVSPASVPMDAEPAASPLAGVLRAVAGVGPLDVLRDVQVSLVGGEVDAGGFGFGEKRQVTSPGLSTLKTYKFIQGLSNTN